MTDQRRNNCDDNPTVEVLVYRNDVLVDTELCESAEQAALVLDSWSDVDGIRCEIADLLAGSAPNDLFEPRSTTDPLINPDEDYPHLR